ncbi:hypothetical protein TrLO_g5242 [Triparma laevis f. longispina]|uniref:Coiled-coil domain-containing protein 86 n=1 Tax=Triparma laevis f. longispina TaxID=1714387 RepID=A0A9W7AAR6_9STRA|nr:hypothetical protein TrLO_g5242 [Triparma laevis f. longispina]
MAVYSKLTVATLKAELDERGVAYEKKSKKAVLIDLLKADDQQKEEKQKDAAVQEEQVEEEEEEEEMEEMEVETEKATVAKKVQKKGTKKAAKKSSQNSSDPKPPTPFSRNEFTPPNHHLEGTFLTTAPPTKGRNTSGRNWKVRPQKRTSTLVTKVKLNNKVKNSWEEKEAQRNRMKEIKAREREIKEQTLASKVAKKQRRLDQEKRCAENQAKSQQFQTMNHNTVGTKMKAMSKKQLRMIKKTRFNQKTGTTELVGAFEK